MLSQLRDLVVADPLLAAAFGILGISVLVIVGLFVQVAYENRQMEAWRMQDQAALERRERLKVLQGKAASRRGDAA